MSAPNPWQQLLIFIVGISLLPAVIAILAKLRILPITVYLLIADSYPEWLYANKRTAVIWFAICVAYPVLTLAWKLFRSWKEEQEATEYLLATGHYWNAPDFEAAPIESELGLSADEDMDW